MFVFAALTTLTTVLNNYYSFGATFYDSAIFQTIIWRSGPSLRMPVSFGGLSFLNTHISLINYLPNALSYLAPFDRITWFGVTYGILNGFLLLTVFIILHRLFGARIIPAFGCTILFYCCGPIALGQFEPRQEHACVLLMIGFFVAWTLDRKIWAVALLLLNATVREDCGALLACPLFLLAAHAWWAERRTGMTRTTIHLFALTLLSVLLSVAAIVFKRRYFHLFDPMSIYYYAPWPNSFTHLSGPIIVGRLKSIILTVQYLWLPGLLSCVGAALLRDIRLSFAFVAFLPYWAFNFFSILNMNATLDAYKSFPFVLMLVWPAILAATAGPYRRRRLALLQIAVLLAATFGWRDGGVRFANAASIGDLKRRWLLRAETEHADIYRLLEPRFAVEGLGRRRVSTGVLALYPYSFDRWDFSLVRDGTENDASHLNSLIWFADDRDQRLTDKFLDAGRFPYRYSIAGTKLRIAARVPPEQLPAFAGLLETTERP